MKTRIIKRVWVNWDITYVIQRKILWFWVDCWSNYLLESYDTLEEAKKNICYYDWTKNKDIINF